MQMWFISLGVSMLALSLSTMILYAWDKRKARQGGWRVPEKRLHLLSLLGGWPGALLAQRMLRHKTVKTRFRIVFWLTVLAHLLVVGGVSYGLLQN